MHDDATALRRFADDGDEDAFAWIVQRHLGLVYAAALRQLHGDAHLAQDVAQSVFTDLARKAGALAPRAATLAGWLYTSTHHAAAKAVRAEQRRRRREQEAHAMQEISDDSARDAAWARMRPHLDALMQRLSRDDRDAIVQRYFAGRSFPEMAALLGVSENGARMRVERALERLRVLMEHRGIRSSAVLLGGVLATEALAAPPAGLAAAVTSTALAQTGGAAAALGLFGMTKLQTIILATAAAGGLAAVGVDMRAQREARTEQAAHVASREAEAVAQSDASADTPVQVVSAAATDEQLMRLRSEKAALEVRLREAPRPARRAAPVPSANRHAAAASERDAPVLDVKELTAVPQPLERKPPVYPFALKALGVPGEVMVSFVVTETGQITDVIAEEASHPAFAEVALQAVAQWRFAPGEKNGVPVNARVRQPLRFNIHSEEWF